jgi:hypothetical protein
MSGAVASVALGLLTSVISGTALWVGQRLWALRRRQRAAAFFGVRAGERCLLVMNRAPASPQGMRHSDIHALIDLAVTLRELGAEPEVTVFDQLTEAPGQLAEFCVGGPDANERAQAHLARFLPGVGFRPYNPRRRDSLAIVAGEQRFNCTPSEEVHALLARVLPAGAGGRPLFVIAGQTAVGNRGAVAYLLREAARLRSLASYHGGQFCVVVRVTQPARYGHGMAELASDLTGTAFAAAPAPAWQP